MMFESPLNFQVTLSCELRQFENAQDYFDDIISKCPVPIQLVEYEDVYIPSESGSILIEYQGKICKCVRKAIVYLQGEYGLKEVEDFFSGQQDHIRISVDYLYER